MATPGTTASPQKTPLASDFETPSRDTWLGLVEKALKGADFEKRLVSHTADGIRVEPLYTRADQLPGSSTAHPGDSPFTRGFHATTSAGGWDIRQLHADTDPKTANSAILTDLNAGVSSVTLQLAAPGQFGLPSGAAALKTALKDVRLDWAPIAFSPGSNFAQLHEDLNALIDEQGFDKTNVSFALNADPLGELARNGTLATPRDEQFTQVASAIKRTQQTYPNSRILLIDGRVYHEAGATQAQELAAMCAALVASLRALDQRGITAADVLPRTAFALTAEADIFLTISKLRAARRIIARVAESAGAAEATTKLHITAVTSQRMMTQRDPWTNLLRTTTACAAAALGGADAITVLPFTWALGRPDDFALRTARNIQIVCQEESSLGRVIDPAGGSWYVEKLTDELAHTAWDQFRQIESEGGLETVLASGSLRERIAEAAAERVKRLATGEEPLTGTSTFPFLAEDGVNVEPHADAVPIETEPMVTPLEPHRLAEPYEALRDRADAFKTKSGTGPQVFLANIGAVADHTARSTWIKNLLAAGGIEAISGDGSNSAKDAAAAFRNSGAKIACICSNDTLYEAHAVDTVSALKAAGATHVYLAGRPRGLEEKLTAAGLTGCLYAGQNALNELQALHDALNVGS